MNLFYVILTALTVSVDSFVAGFSVSLKKRRNLKLPVTVAAVTYLLCLATSLAGTFFRRFLQENVGYIGAAILVALGISALIKKEPDEPCEAKFSQCLAIGMGVGTDGAVANLSLVIQNMGNVYFLPILFAATHFATVYSGQLLAQIARPKHANTLSALMFFALAAAKLLA